MNEVTIRRADPRDLSALTDLLYELFSIEKDFDFDAEKQRRGLALMVEPRDDRCVLVADLDGAIVGMVSIQIVISTAEGGPAGLLEDMVVTARARGGGIGARLLEAAEEWTWEQGATRLQLLADRENAPALDFYRRMKWKPTQLICYRRQRD